MDLLTQKLESWRGRKLAVLGLGVSNRPLVRLLLSAGCQVTGCDRTPREKLDPEVLDLEAMGCSLRVGDGYLDSLEADLVFRTPGMHPENPALVALREKGAEVTSEMDSGVPRSCREYKIGLQVGAMLPFGCGVFFFAW